MNYDNIKELISIIDKSKLTNFELIMDNVSVKMSKSGNNDIDNNQITQDIINPTPISSQIVNTVEKTIENEKEDISDNSADVKGNIVKSPIVGTFYSSTSPGKPPIVSKGDKVLKGDVLCIVEAMKVMNEIVSDFDGEIEEIFVENGQLVEYGEPLFSVI